MMYLPSLLLSGAAMVASSQLNFDMEQLSGALLVFAVIAAVCIDLRQRWRLYQLQRRIWRFDEVR